MNENFYLGVYTKATASRGVYYIRNKSLVLAARAVNPSWVTLSADGKTAYAVEECASAGGRGGGRVLSFAVRPDGTLALTGDLPAGGADPCHLCLDERGRRLFCANYTSGSLAVFSLTEQGALRSRELVVRHRGRGADPVRQAGPHLHFTALCPGTRRLWASDLGLDGLFVYDADNLLRAPAVQTLPAGCGPRHFVFHPSLPLLYAVTELANTVLTVRVAEGGLPGGLLTKTPVADGPAPAENYSAAIRLNRAGTRLYVSCRGRDGAAVFAVEKTGTLRRLGFFPTGGAWPRDLALSPSEDALYCAHQRGGLTRLPLDAAGLPGRPESLPSPESPVCIAFAPSENDAILY